MDDGVSWSAQADFTARLADWDNESDPTWLLQRAERMALVDLNVPHFTAVADRGRAEARIRGLGEDEIAWQIEVIRQNTELLRQRSITARELAPPATISEPIDELFTAEADNLAAMLSDHAVREGPSAAWIGLDWLGDSEVSQLVVLGPDLYNGACGIAVFLAAHAAVTGDTSSEALSRAAVAGLRQQSAWPKPGADGPIARRRRRARSGVDRLRIDGDRRAAGRRRDPRRRAPPPRS